EVDAWGSITIPIGTYEALRVHEHQVQLDCTFLYIVGQWNFQEVEIDTTDMYTWWSNDDEAGFYLAEMEMRSDLKGIVDNVIFLKAKPTQGVAEEAETNAITVYPNPAESYVIIETGSGFTGRIEIRTMLGKTCKTMVCNGSGQQRIALYDLPSGIYLYTVRGSNSSSIYSGKFVKR
ncbi:MAG: T9SS type A sorting domain-containing protein, partial [Deltaproteobacteria bacterium]|nr:T9SS type A sorting domain-containing protein [Deltaproteobacteria bacterium]